MHLKIQKNSKRLLKIKLRQKEEVMHMEDRGLITEIEIVKVTLYWVSQERRIKRTRYVSIAKNGVMYRIGTLNGQKIINKKANF
jgi:hypothetical protein